MRSFSRCIVVVLAAFAGAAPAAGGDVSARRDGASGKPRVTPARYVIRGTARGHVTGLPARDYPVDVLVLVGPGEAAGVAELHLRSRGEACDVRARVGARGTLSFDAGQVCEIALHGEQQGRIAGRLRSGTGRLSARDLALELTWDVSGSVAAAAGTTVAIPGTSTEVTLPATPAVPVSGVIEARASGITDDVSGAR